MLKWLTYTSLLILLSQHYHDAKATQSHHKKENYMPVFIMYPWRRKWQPISVFLPGESPWTEETDGLQSMRSQRVGHDWTTKPSTQHAPLKVSFITGLSKPGSRPRPLVVMFLELFWPQLTTLEKDTALIVLQKGQPSGIVQLLPQGTI